MPRSWIIAAVIALVATGWILSGQLGGPTPSEEAAATPAVAEPAAEPARMTVRVATVVARTIPDTLIVQGRTEADRRVTVRAETTGTVAEVLARRGDRLAAGDPILRLAVDDREAALIGAEALVAQRQIEFDAADNLNRRGHSADTTVAAARAALDQAIAARTLAELEIERMTIRAPFDGVLDDRLVEIGDYVDIGDRIAHVLDLDPILVVGQISERHLGRMTLGVAAAVGFPTGDTAEGHLSYIGRAADETTRTFPVEVEIANPDYAVIDGLTAELTLPMGEIRGHLVSPAVLTLADDGTLGVKALDDEARVAFFAVEVLSAGPDGVWIGGLPERARLITVGQEFVIPGQIVEPVEDSRAPAPPAEADEEPLT